MERLIQAGVKSTYIACVGIQSRVAVIGGYVYHGSSLTVLNSKYIYADYGSGKIWGHFNTMELVYA